MLLSQYVMDWLKLFEHKMPKLSQDTLYPFTWTPSNQDLFPKDDTPWLTDTQIKKIQQIIGDFLFYGQTVDGIMLKALNLLSSQQANATEKFINKKIIFLIIAIHIQTQR